MGNEYIDTVFAQNTCHISMQHDKSRTGHTLDKIAP